MGFHNGKHYGVLALTLLLATSCSGRSSRRGDPPFLYEPISVVSEGKVPVCQRWTMPLRATLSYLSLSQSGKRALVSTSVDVSRAGKMEVLLRFVDTEGSRPRTLWTRKFAQPIKSQALSPDGKFIVITTYDAILHFLNAGGSELWQKNELLGRPYLLHNSSRVLVFNDDDSDPDHAFFTYDYRGKDIGSGQAERETLELTPSPDESTALVTYIHRRAGLFSADGKRIASLQLEGEAVSIAYDRDHSERFYILTRAGNIAGPETLTAYIHDNNGVSKLWSEGLEGSFESLRAFDGVITVYGNTHQGQDIAGYSTDHGKRLWKYSYPNPAIYNTFPHAPGPVEKLVRDFLALTIDAGDKPGILHFMGIGTSGKSLWDTPVAADDGVYALSLSRDGKFALVGASNGGSAVLHGYSIGCGH